MHHQSGPPDRVIFLFRRGASSAETMSSLGGSGATHVCPNQRTRALELKMSGWAAPTAKAPSSRACRQSRSGTTAAPSSRPRATTNGDLPPTATGRSRPLQRAQTPEASRDAPTINSRISLTLSPLWSPLAPPTVGTVEAAIVPPLRPSRGAKAAGAGRRCRGREASLRRKAGPDGTSMTPLTQGMRETWSVFFGLFNYYEYFLLSVCVFVWRFFNCFLVFSVICVQCHISYNVQQMATYSLVSLCMIIVKIKWNSAITNVGLLVGSERPFVLIIQSLQTRQLCLTEECADAYLLQKPISKMRRGGEACTQAVITLFFHCCLWFLKLSYQLCTYERNCLRYALICLSLFHSTTPSVALHVVTCNIRRPGQASN